MSIIKRFLPLFILILGLIIFIVLGGHHYLNIQILDHNYALIEKYTQQHYFLSIIIFISIYIIAIAFSLPGATLLTLLSGLLFGTWSGTLWSVIAATIGATITYLAVKSAFGEFLKNRISGRIAKLQKGFSGNAFNYLLMLRLLPIFPFFIINIAAGIVGVRMRIFILASLIGMTPCAFIYAWIGSGLSSIITQQTKLDLNIFIKPSVIIPLLALAILTMIPVFLKFRQNRKEK
ncbi:MAG: putative membrane protein YdjX (TVP38/TMEM64 family) [Francisellaceae bacterium]